MRIFKKIFFIFLLLFFFSCSSSINKKANYKAKEKFNNYLATRYLTYSQYKAERGNRKYSDYFARKSFKASQNRLVHPELPEEWESKFIIKNVDFDEFKKERKRLLNILDYPKAKVVYPLETANLQFLYDCWLSEESTYDKYDQVSKCKIKYFVLMEYIEDKLSFKEKIMEKEKSEYLISKDYIKEGVIYNVFFDFDSYKLNRNANQTIILILNFLKTMEGDYKITLTGHTDRAGKKLYNEALARKRVLTVKNKLMLNGIPSGNFTIGSVGETTPKIITQDSKREALNRRVSVKIEQFGDDFSPIPLPLDER